MKKNIFFWIYGVVFCFMALAIYGMTSVVSEKQNRAFHIARIPQLPMVDLDSVNVTPSKNGSSTIIILFNSECEHCQDEVAQISASEIAFKDMEVFLVSSEAIHIIKAFKRTFDGKENSNIHYVKVDYNSLLASFGSITYPESFLYSPSGHLIKEFKGEVQVSTMLQALKAK